MNLKTTSKVLLEEKQKQNKKQTKSYIEKFFPFKKGLSSFLERVLLTLLIMEIASVDKNLGYLTSSFTILSKTSSSSSPGKGDWKRHF